ncbi:MAG: hypothetical protein ACRYFV_15205 [Janthinobacterium lividum]
MKQLTVRSSHYLSTVLVTSTLLLGTGVPEAHAQVEIAPWGNLTGIRQEGQLLDINSSLQLVVSDWAHATATGRERQRPHYTRQGAQQRITTRLDSLNLTETVADAGPGKATVTVSAAARSDMAVLGLFFALALPPQSAIELLDAQGKVVARRQASGPPDAAPVLASRLRIIDPTHRIEVGLPEPTAVLLKNSESRDKQNQGPHLYLPILAGHVAKSQTTQKTYTFTATGTIDRAPIHLTLNTAQPGRAFAGFGGNFRLQNPTGDPQVIDYCLKNMRVAYGRVEMPWQLWQPNLTQDPTAAAKQGQLHPHVRESMEMAQRLGKLGMPVIVTAWSAPQWAVVGEQGNGTGPGANGRWGAPLNQANIAASYKSIADYLVYLKEQYGLEAVMFSFNESDLGINIRQTGQEHDELIKGLGAYFVSRGLKTKLLLGDNSDATSNEFIYPALRDPAARPYIGAVSFHSWRGWDTETLQKWTAAAKEINLPLLVGEGSIDAQAWGYPQVFEEPTYAQEEISLYMRLLTICQPLSILQWQLTSDYSPLAGGGIFGNNAPLHPTQRFWNLKQLAATPKDVVFMPLTADRPNVTCAAMGNAAKGAYAVHVVNNGATRQVTLTGLPDKVKTLRSYVTDQQNHMKEGPRMTVTKGQAHFTAAATSYTTLSTE